MILVACRSNVVCGRCKLRGNCWSSAGRSFVMRSLNPCPENFDQIVVVWVNYQSWGGGGVIKRPNANCEKLPNQNLQTYQLQMIDSGGGGGGKLPNANCEHQTTK